MRPKKWCSFIHVSPLLKLLLSFSLSKRQFVTLGQYLQDAVPWGGGPAAPPGNWGSPSPAAARKFPFAALRTGRNKEPGGDGEGRREE